MGADVIMVVKGKIGKSGATASRVSDIASFSIADNCNQSNDSIEDHFQETIDAGMGMCDPKLVRILVEDSLNVMADFEKWKIPFMASNEKHIVHLPCFGKRHRMHIVEGFGPPVMKILERIIIARGIKIIPHLFVVDLVVSDGKCIGAFVLGPKDETIVIEANATVMATGGGGRLFKHTLYPKDITGDGIAMALRAGADLINLEFMQMGIGIATPKLLIGNWIWKLYPDIVDIDRKSIVNKYLPDNVNIQNCFDDKSTHWPFSVENTARHIDITVFKENRCKDSKRDTRVSLDLRNRIKEIKINDPLIGMRYKWLLSRNIDLSKELIPIINYSHSFNGGVLIDEFGQTTVPGLYAAGETAGGMHGANRLGGNMLLACFVFGARAGAHAAREANKSNRIITSQSVDYFLEKVREARTKDTGMIKILTKWIREVFSRELMVIRNEAGMKKALEKIYSIRGEFKKSKSHKNQDARKTLEFYNLLTLGEVITKAALKRKESRGSHNRVDVTAVGSNRYRKAMIISKFKKT